jgi:predicted kinase
MNNKVIIMRGIPGSGKTSFLEKYFPEANICSADNYRMVNGKYVFDPLTSGSVHNECLRHFLKLLRNGEAVIAVDNTNTKVYELAPYYRLAEIHGYDPYIFYLPVNAVMAADRNKHEVPRLAVLGMAAQLEPLPVAWNQHIITPEWWLQTHIAPRLLVFPEE